MALERRSVAVWADWEGIGGPILMGLLHAEPLRNFVCSSAVSTILSSPNDLTAKHFRLKPARVEQIITQVTEAVRGWRAEAEATGLSRSEQERMAPAFRLAERESK